jgi:hypothetical protein
MLARQSLLSLEPHLQSVIGHCCFLLLYISLLIFESRTSPDRCPGVDDESVCGGDSLDGHLWRKGLAW